MPGNNRVSTGAFHIQLFSLAVAATAWDKIRILRLIRLRQSKEASPTSRLVDLPRQIMNVIEEFIAVDTFKTVPLWGGTFEGLSKVPLHVTFNSCCQDAFTESPEHEAAFQKYIRRCRLEELEAWDDVNYDSEGSESGWGDDYADPRSPPDHFEIGQDEDYDYEAFEMDDICADAFAEFIERHEDEGECMLATGDMAFWEKAAPTNHSALTKADPFEYKESVSECNLINFQVPAFASSLEADMSCILSPAKAAAYQNRPFDV